MQEPAVTTNPTFGMSFLERIRYDREQEKLRAIEKRDQLPENSIFALLGLSDEAEAEADPAVDDEECDTSSLVDDDEQW